MDKSTVQVYENQAEDYARNRPPAHGRRARALARTALAERPLVDLGCGPAGYAAYLGSTGRTVIGLDAAGSMLALARHRVPCVRADLEALPFRLRSLGGAWARNTYLHVAQERLPLALADLHRALDVGAPVVISVVPGADFTSADDLPGRAFFGWDATHLLDIVLGAGFSDVEVVEDHGALWVTARRDRTLPDYVGPGMRLLVCGLNPSLVAADAGFGYAGPSNRFWRAATTAGVMSRPFDPRHGLCVDRVGMTDLVKRATPRASLLTADDYRAGAARVERLVSWLQPEAVCFVGLEGWRAVLDRTAQPGWQRSGIGGVPAYVMPSTSGLNARTSLGELIEHLRTAVGGWETAR